MNLADPEAPFRQTGWPGLRARLFHTLFLIRLVAARPSVLTGLYYSLVRKNGFVSLSCTRLGGAAQRARQSVRPG